MWEWFLRETFLCRKSFLPLPLIRLNRTFLGRFSVMSGSFGLAKSIRLGLFRLKCIPSQYKPWLTKTLVLILLSVLKCSTRIKRRTRTESRNWGVPFDVHEVAVWGATFTYIDWRYCFEVSPANSPKSLKNKPKYAGVKWTLEKR